MKIDLYKGVKNQLCGYTDLATGTEFCIPPERTKPKLPPP